MMNILFAVAVLGILGAIFGLVLAVASKIFEVKKDPREEAILGLLAGANCGGCGYPGCGGCAAAILAGEAPRHRLRPCRGGKRRRHRQDHGHGGSHRGAAGGLRPLHRRRQREKAL